MLPASAYTLIAVHHGPEELWMAETDHVFNAFASDEMLEKMIETTIDWFNANAN